MTPSSAKRTRKGPLAGPGVVHLVGAGPGDPGLLTVRAVELLGAADVVLYDRLIPPEALALLDRAVEIPMIGTGLSLNVVVAGSLVAYRLAGML